MAYAFLARAMPIAVVQRHYTRAISDLAVAWRSRRPLSDPKRSSGRRIRPVTYVSVVRRARDWVAEREALSRRYARMMSIPDIIADPEITQFDAPEGLEVIRQIRIDIDHLHPRPTDFQLEIIWFVVELMAPRIFGARWQTDRARIKKQMGWTAHNYGIGGILTGRKEGKSTGLAMAVVIVAMNLPSILIALFSLTINQSTIILGMAKTILFDHPRSAEFKVNTSTQKISLTRLRADGRADTREVRAWSGSANVRAYGNRTGAGETHSLFSFPIFPSI